MKKNSGRPCAANFCMNPITIDCMKKFAFPTIGHPFSFFFILIGRYMHTVHRDG